MHVFGTVHAEPRDSVEAPTYRVNFWDYPPPHEFWALDAYVLTEVADITEVLAWVETNARGRRVEVFAEMDDDESEGQFADPRKTGLIRLLGTNPNAGDKVEIGRFVKI